MTGVRVGVAAFIISNYGSTLNIRCPNTIYNIDIASVIHLVYPNGSFNRNKTKILIKNNEKLEERYNYKPKPNTHFALSLDYFFYQNF